MLLLAAAIWHSITFNDARLVVPMDFSKYTYQIQDLPMILALTLVILYVLYLFALLLITVINSRNKSVTTPTTRSINPKLGLLGLLGFVGFVGFVTYRIDKSFFPFAFFTFFGFFGFYYEGKLSNVLMDEMYREHKLRADAAANKIAITIIFLALIILGQGSLMGNPEYTLIAFIIIVSLSLALEIFLSQYLLYRYEHDGQLDESED